MVCAAHFCLTWRYRYAERHRNCTGRRNEAHHGDCGQAGPAGRGRHPLRPLQGQAEPQAGQG